MRWAMVVGSVGSSAVVVPDVGREYHTHAPLIEDQHAVGEFGSEGADESFGKTVRLGTTRRNSDHADADIFEYSVERRCELMTSSPCTLRCPQIGFSAAIRITRFLITAAVGGRPGRWRAV